MTAEITPAVGTSENSSVKYGQNNQTPINYVLRFLGKRNANETGLAYLKNQVEMLEIQNLLESFPGSISISSHTADFEDNCLDYIYAKSEPTEKSSLDKTFSEYERILRPGGDLILLTWIDNKILSRNDLIWSATHQNHLSQTLSVDSTERTKIFARH